MTTISIPEAQTQLPQLIAVSSEEIGIVDNERAAPRILSPEDSTGARKLDSLSGTTLYMSPDFDAPLLR